MADTFIQDGSSTMHNGHCDSKVSDVMDQAQQLLGQLRVARQAVEQRQAESGRFDPMKKVTGRSSLDNAIERTESLIRDMRVISSSAPATSVSIETNADACDGMAHALNGRGHRNGRRAALALAR